MRLTMERLTVQVGLVLLVAACGGGDPAPGAIPQIEGVYTGVWSLAVEDDRVSCPAALTIHDQTDSLFATTFEVLRRDAPGLGCVDLIQEGSGIVRATHTVTALAELVEPVTCALKEPNRGLSGPFAGDSLVLSGRYTYECAQDYAWTFRFSGSTAADPLPSYPDVRGTFDGTWTTVTTGIQVTCPVTVTLDTQARDQVTGSYTLEPAGTCAGQAAEALIGVVTIDGALTVSTVPPVPAGCAVQQALTLTGDATGGTLDLAGAYALVCGGSLREFGVLLAATQT